MPSDAGPRQHIVLRERDYPDAGAPEPPEAGILIEVGEPGRRPRGEPRPWDSIAPGERIWLLYESDIVATAVVDRVAQLDWRSTNDLRQLAVGSRLHESEEFWRSLSHRGFLGRHSAVVTWTRDVRWRDPPLRRLVRFRAKRHRLDSWIVVTQADDLAEVDAPPEVDAPLTLGGAAAAAGRDPTANIWAIFGLLLVGVIGLMVLAVVVLIWVL